MCSIKKSTFMKTKFNFSVFLFLILFGMSSCNEDSEGIKNPDVVWEYESFMFEAYSGDGNPYIVDGVDESNYPIGKIITRDEMHGEQDLKVTFGDDGFIYWVDYNSDGIKLDKLGSYNKNGNFLTGDGCYSLFFPMKQVAPPGFDFETNEVTNEILEWTEQRLCVKQTQISSGMKLVTTNNFRRVVTE